MFISLSKVLKIHYLCFNKNISSVNVEANNQGFYSPEKSMKGLTRVYDDIQIGADRSKTQLNENYAILVLNITKCTLPLLGRGRVVCRYFVSDI